MAGWIDALRGVLEGTTDLVNQGPFRLNNIFKGSPEQQKQYKQWFDTQMKAMGLNPLGDNPEILGDLGYSPSSAVVMNPKNAAEIFEKLETYKALGNSPSQVAELFARLKNMRLSGIASLEDTQHMLGANYDPLSKTISYNSQFFKPEEIPGVLKHENIHAWQALKSNRLKEDPYLIPETLIKYQNKYPRNFKELLRDLGNDATFSDLSNELRNTSNPIDFGNKKLNYFGGSPNYWSELSDRLRGIKKRGPIRLLQSIMNDLYRNQPIEKQAVQAQETARKAFEKFQELTGFKF